MAETGVGRRRAGVHLHAVELVGERLRGMHAGMAGVDGGGGLSLGLGLGGGGG